MNLSSEQIADFVDHARAYDASEGQTDPDTGSNAADDGMTDVLQDDPENLEAQDIAGFVDALNDEARAELVALVWVGRGDFEAADWREAVAAARDRLDSGPTSAYLLGIPNVGDLVGEGYAAIAGDSGR
jgi:hypothetical protein